ncbi:calpain-like protein, partial [Trypanosoma theileri]
MTVQSSEETPDSNKVFNDTIFMEKNKHISSQWIRIGELYPNGLNQPLLPPEFSREQFGQGNHYECFMLTALSTLVRFPDVIQNCFVSKNVRRDGRYTFQFFRGKQWVKVEIDDYIPLDEDEVLYIRSPTQHWWPLLLEKAYAKFYTGYESLEGCTLQEAYYDLTGKPVLNIPMDPKLAKAAGAEVTEGHYWLELAQKIQSGQFVASVLTRDMEIESMGLQREQQYGILEVFSLTGTSSVQDIVVHLHNPFEDEEFIYRGPLNSKDSQWTPKLRAKYNVDDERSIFLPLHLFLKFVNSMQLCYISPLEADATYFDDEWKGETAGGNPTSVTWRKNPLYYVRNTGTEPIQFVAMIKQEDQRHEWTQQDEDLKYKQCGLIVVQYSYARPILTYFVTGNNHKTIHKSLFLNSREVANAVTIPPGSLCYFVPSCMTKGAEAKFTVAIYRMKNYDYSNFHFEKVYIPLMDWEHATVRHVELQVRTKDRVDFYVEEATDVHVLMHQLKPYVSPKTGGDAMAQDYMGMYLYDDTDRKIGGVHAATNFRETGILYHLPRSGRYAISVTCPRGKGTVPAQITIVASKTSKVREVEPPEDAGMFDDEDIIDEGDDVTAKVNPIDYTPINIPPAHITEVPDSAIPFEDKRFMVDNKIITNDPWIHIGDLYPEGKTLPLVPETLSREQFEQGEHFECCCLTAFATLVDHHPDVIRNAFVSKAVRKDGRYTFRFHRYGQWVKVEIDDRIPLIDGQTLFCRSPTRHWWPLLLEKAYAKFYTLYQNIEGCTLQEVYHDFTGQPVVSIPTDVKLAKSAMYDVDEPDFWLELNNDVKNSAYGAVTRTGLGDHIGLHENQGYAFLGVVSTVNKPKPLISELLVKLHNPFVEAVYTGPMNNEDSRWTPELRSALVPEERGVIYMPVEAFCDAFSNIVKVFIRGLVQSSWHFNSEWGEGTNGGNPTLVTWRENPLYVVRNNSDEPLQIMALICQPDQRHMLHHLHDRELNYIQCGLVLSQNVDNTQIPTYLVTANNHRMIVKGLYMDSREVSSTIVLPPRFFGYLVPSAMFHEQSKFLLSYWYTNPDDSKVLSIERLKVNVARHLPAIAHVTLQNGGKERVDFIVDTPTDVHILLRQEKPYRAPNCSDAMTEDYLGMYLYDSDYNRLSGVASATNFRETGIVHHITRAGQYAISITCPHATGPVPARVEIVAMEEAHVRISEPPTEAPEFKDLDYEYTLDNFAAYKPQLSGDLSQRPSTRAAERISRIVSASTGINANDPEFSFLDPEPEGIPIADIPLMKDAAFAEMAKERMKLKQNAAPNASRISELEEEMNKRAHEIAKRMHEKERTYLDPEPEGIPLDLLPLNEDEAFSKMEDELRALNRKPRKDIHAIASLEDQLYDRAHELAKELKDTEREMFLDPQPGGVPLSELPLDTDEPFHTMEIERLRLRKDDPIGNADRIKELEDRMNERAEELAKMSLKNDRAFLDPEPLGFPLDELGLDYNDDFVNKEAELRELKKDPRRNAAAIKALEEKLAKMVYDIARKKAALDRKFLDPEPEGRLVGSLPLDDDKAFVAMDTKRRQMARNGGDPDKIKALEEEMNAAAHEMARALNAKERPEYLRPFPKGVPLEDLPLDADEKFRELEAKRQQLKRDPKRHAAALSDVEAALNARAEELAQKHLADDRAYLDPAPEGVPLRLLPLDTDGPFKALEAKRAKLKNQKTKSSAKAVRDLEDDLNDRAAELAVELKQAERKKFLDPKPNGVPIANVPIDSDKLFRDMEIQRLLLCEDPVKNATAIKNLEDAMNERARELAAKILADERAFLDPAPLGIPLAELPLDSNEEFMAKEAQLRELRKDRGRNARAIAALEDELNGLARRIAAEELAKFRSTYLDPEPEGRLIDELPLNDDKEFMKLEQDLRNALKDPTRDPEQIESMKAALNAMAYAKAKALNVAERPQYLNPRPLNIDVQLLPLDDDETFHSLEVQRARLKHHPKKNKSEIEKVEKLLNDRALQLAKEVLKKDRGYLHPSPEGVPLSLLPLDTDPTFQELETKRFGILGKDPVNDKALAQIEEKLNERAKELANEYKAKSRDRYVSDHDLSVPIQDLSLDMDLPFQGLETKLFQLLAEDPEKNAHLINAVEEALQKRVQELDNIRKEEQRQFLDQNPYNIPLSELPINEDPEFLRKEEELRRLRRDPLKTDEIAAAEKSLNEMVRGMAANKIKQKYNFLDQNPEGVPLHDLWLDEDPQFVAMEEERKKLIEEDPRKNAQRIADLEEEMNDRAHELAREKKQADRAFLDHNPEGVPLRELPLDEDPQFVAIEQERKKLMDEDPRKNAQKIAGLEKDMNDRAHELAREKKQADRAFLDQNPEGVPLSELPLDEDPQFAAMEQDRKQLMDEDPRKNAQKIAGLEKDMNDRAHELAREKKQADRAFLDQNPEGVPLSELPLDEDPQFAAMEQDRKQLMDEDPRKNAQKIAGLEKDMNDRAHELAREKKQADRAFLDQNPEGVPLRELPLDDDSKFAAMEEERKQLMDEDPRKNAQKIRGLEKEMNDRAHELAREK